MIRRLVLATLAMAFGSGAVSAQAESCEGLPGPDRLVITITGVDNARGLMTASLYPDDKTQFLVKNGALKVWTVPARPPITRMCIYLKGPGDYAVAVYQDENGNHRWDHALLRHIEPFGFSRNPPIFFAAPSLDETRFAAGPGTTAITIRLDHR